jgi:holo-[acyl-carrier protein] synthase
MSDAPAPAGRCITTPSRIARIERLLAGTPAEDLAKLFSPGELADSGVGPGRAASLAARFAAKEACVKLFPREAASGEIVAADFAVATDNYGAPRVVCAPRARDVLGRHRIASIALSLTHDRVSASAVALAQPAPITVPLSGRVLFRLLPLRRAIVLANLSSPRRSPPEADIRARTGALRASLAPGRGIPALPLALGRGEVGTRARGKPRHLHRGVPAGQGGTRADRPFRELGSRDDSRHRQLPRSARTLPFRPLIKLRWLDRVTRRRKRGFGAPGKRGSLTVLDLPAPVT